MPTWDEAARWYLDLVTDPARGFNDLAASTCLDLLGDVSHRDVLDLGCGEGHVARRLARAGARVHAIDPVTEFLDAAAKAERHDPLGIRYDRDNAEELHTVATNSADLVCAVLVLHHVHDLDAALAQVHRVLRPGGVLVGVQPHPWSDHPGAAWTCDPATGNTMRRAVGDYLDEGPWSSGVASGQDITSVRDIGWHHHTLATWLTALATNGFRLQVVREPTGSNSARADNGGPWATVPRFFAFRATASDN
jgi:SAM-dependent methyltransferase